MFWKSTELCHFVTYLWNDPRNKNHAIYKPKSAPAVYELYYVPVSNRHAFNLVQLSSYRQVKWFGSLVMTTNAIWSRLGSIARDCMRCALGQRRLPPTLPLFQYFHTVLQHLHSFYAPSFPTSVQSISNPNHKRTIYHLLQRQESCHKCEQVAINTVDDVA